MRLVIALIVAAALLMGGFSRAALAAQSTQDDGIAMSQPVGETAADDDDDTVDVQLLVLGVAGGVVFLLLPLGYLLRRRLGRTAYTPPPADAH